VTFASQKERQGLKVARDAFKLGGRFDTARNEVLFANRALLLEAYGDRIAALIIAEKMKFDVDAEGIAIVDCGGKSGIELVIRVCEALGIPFVVVHDEDIWPLENISDLEKRNKQEKENKDEQQKNQRIRDAVGTKGGLFILCPSLEAALNISRDARDKPRRISEALEAITPNKPPENLEPLFQAVRMIMGDADKHQPAKISGNSEMKGQERGTA
jgi:putative ATP-dependent endonuclease of the OLD family